MNRDLWKRILSSISDEELAEMINIWGIQVKGFRQVTTENIVRARTMITSELLKVKNLRIIKKFYEMMSDGLEIDNTLLKKEIRDMDGKELIDTFDEGFGLHFILGILYTSSEEEHHRLAQEFEEHILHAKGASSLSDLQKVLEKTDEEELTETRVEAGNNESAVDWEKKWQKSENKNKDLKKKNEELERKYKELKDQTKAEKQSALKEKQQLQQELGSERAAIKEKATNYEAADRTIAELKEEIASLKSNISHLNALLLNSKNEVAAGKEEHAQSLGKADNKAAVKRIILIGNPRNRLISESDNPVFKVIEPNETGEQLTEEVVKTHDAIWIISYLVPPQIKKKIKRTYKENVQEFTDFATIKRYIEKGN